VVTSVAKMLIRLEAAHALYVSIFRLAEHLLPGRRLTVSVRGGARQRDLRLLALLTPRRAYRGRPTSQCDKVNRTPCLSSARSSSRAKGRLPARHEGLAKEALQQLFSCIEASTPPRIIVVGPIMVGPTIVGVVGVVIRSIVGPVIATVGVTIAAMPDFLDCSSANLD
jgi:hypothetical protein